MTAPTIRSPRRHMLCAPLQAFFKAQSLPTPAVSEVPLLRLIGMLDCEHCDKSKYVVVCTKPKKAGSLYAVYVLDVPLGKVYCARPDTGMVRFMRALAQRRAPHVQYVDGKDVATMQALVLQAQQAREIEMTRTFDYGQFAGAKGLLTGGKGVA